MTPLTKNHLLVSTISLIMLATTTIAGATCTPSTSAQCRLTNGINASINSLRTNVSAGHNVNTRDLVDAALADMVINGSGSATEAMQWTLLAFSKQDTNSSSSTYGEVYWNTGDTGVTDPNATEFATTSVGPLLLQFSSDFNSTDLATLQTHLQYAMIALARHISSGSIPVSYTNAYVMNTASRMLIGQYLGDTTSVSAAESQLNGWLNTVKTYGIHEFDSPRYTDIQMQAVTNGYLFATATNDIANFQTALDYLWLDVGANYFPASDKISGGFSRDYDFLNGLAELRYWPVAVGWSPASIYGSTVDLFEIPILEMLKAATPYTVASDTTTLATGTPDKQIFSTWGDSTVSPRSNHVYSNVTIGCTSGFYSAQDKLFEGSFTGGLHTTEFSLILDSSGQPYGLNLTPDGSGHQKPNHARSNLGCSQGGAGALLTEMFDASSLVSPATGLWTNFLFPNTATVAVNGTNVTLPTSPGSISLASTDVVTIKVGSGVMGIRLLHADAVNGVTPTWSIVVDSTGLSNATARLVLTHMTSIATPGSSKVRAAFLVRVDNGSDVSGVTSTLQNATITDTQDGTNWTMEADFSASETLSVVRSQTSRDDVGTSYVNGGIPTRYALATIRGTTFKNDSQVFWADSAHTIH